MLILGKRFIEAEPLAIAEVVAKLARLTRPPAIIVVVTKREQKKQAYCPEPPSASSRFASVRLRLWKVDPSAFHAVPWAKDVARARRVKTEGRSSA